MNTILMNTASSIGIIGGADGPTAIFMTARVSPWLWLLGGVFLVGLVVAGFFWKKH